MQLDKDNPPSEVEFCGITYRLMGGKRRYYLSQSRSNEGRRNAKGLHVAIWEHHSGRVVPADHEIHHVNGDTFDCRPENLECLPRSVHRSLPKSIDMERVQQNLERIRPLASEWHGSEAGIEWHRMHAYRSIKKPGAAKPFSKKPWRTGSCEWCGSAFQAKSERKTLCSNRCQTAVSKFKRGKSSTVTDHYKSRLQSDG